MARSDNWRINKSGQMAIEGAQILKALQKVAGAAGLPSNFKVKFATEAHGSGIDFNAKEVVIGAGRLFKEAPVPADLFDVLVGLTLHETGHQTIQTDKVGSIVERYCHAMPDQEVEVFQKFVNIGEDVVVESRTRNNPNLAEYDEVLHNWAVSQMREAQPHKLLEVWIEYALGHKSTTVLNLPPELDAPMQQLVALTGWLRTGGNYHERARSYLQYWTAVKDTILTPQPPAQPQDVGAGDNLGQQDSGSAAEPSAPAPDKQDDEPEPDEPEPSSSNSGAEDEPPQQPEQNEDNATGDGGEDTSAPEQEDEEDELERPLTPKAGDSIDGELAEAIEDAIESDSEDITEQVAEEVAEQTGDTREVYPVIRSRETKTPLIKPDAQLRKKLERIMTIRKRLQSRTMHGEQYGRIDKRHLHRIGTDQKVFSLRYKFPDGFPNTRILLDLSSSMSGREADEVLEAAGALQTLVNAEVWCYNRTDRVNLVRMDEGKLIHTFVSNGDTPSGLAIIGVAVGMKKDGLVIHLTDGESNTGQSPWVASWILRKKGINLVNLIWGYSTKQYSYDGMSYQQLGGLADFPEALYQIVLC